jgi:hypothetical protein
VLRFVFRLLAIVCLAGCEKQSGEAVVLAKEHIAAAPPISKTSRAGPAASPNEVSTSAEQPRPIGDEEITVDGYVMKPDVRGTSHDPRALKDEQWLVKVRMLDDGPHVERSGGSRTVRQTKGGRSGTSQIPARQIYEDCLGRGDRGNQQVRKV